MNPILLSFLCGSAFIGGAVVTTLFAMVAWQAKDRAGRSEIAAYWQESLKCHAKQLKILERMASAMEPPNKSVARDLSKLIHPPRKPTNANS